MVIRNLFIYQVWHGLTFEANVHLPVCVSGNLIVWFSTEITSASPRDPANSPSFLHAAGGMHEPRWQQRGWRAGARTHARTGVVMPFSLRFAGGDCAPHTQARAAILKVTPHSGSDRAAVRNHDWRWRILSSWRDMPDSEMGKRSIVWLHSLAALLLTVSLNFLCLSPQWKTRWLVLRKPSPVAGNLFHTLVLF